MRLQLKGLPIMALVLGAWAGSPVAHAATVSATASITDVSGKLLNLSNDSYITDVGTAPSAGQATIHETLGSGSTLTPISFNDPIGSDGFAAAEIGGEGLGDDSLPQSHAAAGHRGLGFSTVLWSFDWTAKATGTATFRLEYLYAASIVDFKPGETGIASSFISLGLDGSPDKQIERSYLLDGGNGDTSGFDSITLAFGVIAGQKGSITVSVASNALVAPAAVPIPAAAGLFLSGLGGLVGWSRRQKISA